MTVETHPYPIYHDCGAVVFWCTHVPTTRTIQPLHDDIVDHEGTPVMRGRIYPPCHGCGQGTAGRLTTKGGDGG